MSIATLISYFPSALILMTAPKLVPNQLDYHVFIKTVVFVMGISMLFMPLMRDLLSHTFVANHEYFVLINVILIYCFNPKLFSPFVNYVVNMKMPHEDKTALNSITFISSTLSSSILMNLLTPLYSLTYNIAFFQNMRPFNKYVIFIIMILILSIGFFSLGKLVVEHDEKLKNLKKKKEEKNEEKNN